MAQGTGDQIESKARNPRSWAKPASDTSCPPRGPHHFRPRHPPISFQLSFVPSSSFLGLSNPAAVPLYPFSFRSWSSFYLVSILGSPKVPPIPLFLISPPSSHVYFLLRPAFVSLLSYALYTSCSLLPAVLLAARSPANRSRPARVCPRRADLPLRRLPGVTARAHEVPSAWRRSRKTAGEAGTTAASTVPTELSLVKPIDRVVPSRRASYR